MTGTGDFYDDLETRDREAREAALMAALPGQIADAKANAYRAVDMIDFEGAYCRRDIADKAVSPAE